MDIRKLVESKLFKEEDEQTWDFETDVKVGFIYEVGDNLPKELIDKINEKVDIEDYGNLHINDAWVKDKRLISITSTGGDDDADWESINDDINSVITDYFKNDSNNSNENNGWKDHEWRPPFERSSAHRDKYPF